MAQKNKKTAKKRKKNLILVILLIIFGLIIIGEAYLLFAKANTLWPYDEQGMVVEQKPEEEEKDNNTEVEQLNEPNNKDTNSNSYNNANYNDKETVTTDESINENGIDTTKQSTETQQDLNVLYGPEE